MTEPVTNPDSGRRTDLVWTALAVVAALVLLVWGLRWAGDIRFSGDKRELATKVVIVGGALGFLVAEGIRRWKKPLGIAAFVVLLVSIPLALMVVVERGHGVIADSTRRATATEADLPEPVALRDRTGDDVRELDVEVALEEFVPQRGPDDEPILDTPIDVAFLGDGTMLVAERDGRVVAVGADGELAPDVVVDITAETSTDGERGLLGIAVSPSGRLYAHHSDLAGDNRVLSWRLDDLVADPSSRLEVLSVEQTKDNHNGGGIAFGPDGMLYVAIGDGGGVGDPKDNAQAAWNRLGTVLRVIPDEVSGDYLIPPDNPWVDDDEIWPETIAYGLRNPVRIRFDSVTGDLWIGDVGDANFEEINLIPAGDFGQNFGWNRMEADQVFAGPGRNPTGFDESDIPDDHTVPAFFYAHDKSEVEDVFSGTHEWRNSVTGGVRYRGSEIDGLYGVYLHADFAAMTLGGVTFDTGLEAEADVVFDLEVPVPISIVEDPSGEVYVVSLGGTIYRLIAASSDE